MESWQETDIQSLLAAESEAALFESLSGTAKDLGFEYCAYGMRMPLPVSHPKVFMLNNYSAQWQQRYREEGYLEMDPTVAHGTCSVMPLVWSEGVFAKCRRFWEDAWAHGLRFGWSQSCYDARGVGGLLTLARSAESMSAAEVRSLLPKVSWMTQAAHEGMSRLLLPRYMPEASATLSAREIEVLRWTADGKTSCEVGMIMNIAERTVNFHVNSALEKLGAVNKTSATIKAAMLGLL
ncbi:MAG TPA: LuxR family transcriptional regulator [Gammaproteobacteria bacterium]|nr:LuxR family transcriptional regulator [Gammaproteobacteria bacterium]